MCRKNEEIEKNQPAAVATAAATTAPAQRQQSWPSSRRKVNRQNKIAWQKNILQTTTTHTHTHILFMSACLTLLLLLLLRLQCKPVCV